jgi:hypothetical protein
MAIEYVPYNLTDEQVRELWDRYRQGETVAQLARRFGKQDSSMYERIQAAGGIHRTIPTRAGRHLTLEDCEEISRGLEAGHSLRQVGCAPTATCRADSQECRSLTSRSTRPATCLRLWRPRIGVTALAYGHRARGPKRDSWRYPGRWREGRGDCGCDRRG